MQAGVMQYLKQRMKNPFFSETIWAVSVANAVTINHQTDGAVYIYAYMWIVNSVAGNELRLTDSNNRNIILIPACNVSQLLQVPINHIMPATSLRFTAGASNEFSIGYQYIYEGREALTK